LVSQDKHLVPNGIKKELRKIKQIVHSTVEIHHSALA